MARSRKVANGQEASSSSPTRSPSLPPSPDIPTGPLSIVIPHEDREVVKINNSNLTDLKNACDDAVKRYLSRPELFKQIFLHTDVRLALGWSSVLVAAGTALYGYKVEFEIAKPVVWVGLSLYIIVSFVQTLYAYFVEGDTVFVGKRKTFSKRIVTERITLASRTEPVKQSKPPSYELTVSYVRSTSNGKSLLAKGKTRSKKEYNAFFDENGVMDQERFEKYVGELVEQAMEGKAT